MELRAFEVDAKLLEQLNALGTTDKDELINQLKSIVGTEIPSESCQFFLELAGWNLQRAIGAYFDFSFENSPPINLPTNIGDSRISNSAPQEEMQIVAPLEEFDLRIWPTPSGATYPAGSFKVTVENCGSAIWPHGTYLRSESNPLFARLASRSEDSGQILWLPIGLDGRIPILPLLPSQMIELTINVLPPSQVSEASHGIVGAMTFCLPDGERFGEILYCTAIPNINEQTWCYQRGVLDGSVITSNRIPFSMEEF